MKKYHLKKYFNNRDLIFIIVIIYLLAKLYVLHTPSPIDDDVPEKVRDSLLEAVGVARRA
jgi:hypothetical protein